MIYIQMILIPLFSIGVLYILTRIIGYRQMSQLSLFDYVNGITIGSIAAEMATSKLSEIERSLMALIIYGVFTLLFAVVTDKSIGLRRKLSGKSICLVFKGKFYDTGFKKAHIDLSEFMIQCRNQGYFDINQIDTALMEPNGIISILPKSQIRPVTPSDMNFVIEQEELPSNVIMDGKIMYENLKNIGFDEKWLRKQMREYGFSLEEVFVGTCNISGQAAFYRREGERPADILY